MGAFKYSEQGQTALLTEYFNSFSRLCFLYRIHDWRLEGVPVNLGSLITSTTTAVGGTFPMHFQKFSNCNGKRQELRLCQNGDGVTTAVLKQFQLPGLDRKKPGFNGDRKPSFCDGTYCQTLASWELSLSWCTHHAGGTWTGRTFQCHDQCCLEC